jgi:hypothetical protein
MAGYSGTPLAKKLGIQDGHHVVLLGAPDGFEDTLEPLPPVKIDRSLRGKLPIDVAVVFVTRRADLEARVTQVQPRLAPAGGLWIAWPKKASKVPTDIVEDTIRDVCLPRGLVDNKVCAIDEIWSGLRVVIRKALR